MENIIDTLGEIEFHDCQESNYEGGHSLMKKKPGYASRKSTTYDNDGSASEANADEK